LAAPAVADELAMIQQLPVGLAAVAAAACLAEMLLLQQPNLHVGDTHHAG
jgi:hypothetical protein